MSNELTIIETQVLNLIPKGEATGRTLKEICSLIDLDTRSVQSVVNRLVMIHGVPICSCRNGSGYFIPETLEQRDDALKSIKSQVSEMTSRIEKVESINLQAWDKNIKLAYQLSLLDNKNLPLAHKGV